MVFDCMDKANVYPVEAVVKVDDTAAEYGKDEMQVPGRLLFMPLKQ